MHVEFRQDAGQTRGEHRLADAGRPRHEHVVPARCGDFERVASLCLPADVRKVGAGSRGLRFAQARRRGRIGNRTARDSHGFRELGEVEHLLDLDPCQFRFFPASEGHGHCGVLVRRSQSRRQYSAHGAHRPVQAELAHDVPLPNLASAHCREDRHRYAEVERRAAFRRVRRRKVDRQARLREADSS